MGINGKIVEVKNLKKSELHEMYNIMDKHYDNMKFENFMEDIEEKEHCIILQEEDSLKIVGFSTQKVMKIEIEGEEFYGVFSGDTVIEKEHWGSMELYKIFARFFIEYGKQYGKFYWFLISKGYKTYKMLPLFFNEFYPNYRAETPYNIKKIMDKFGETRYRNEYSSESGVINYNGKKDRVKAGIADITDRLMEDMDIEYFVKKNPKYTEGNDLVCIARLSEENLKPAVKRVLLRDKKR